MNTLAHGLWGAALSPRRNKSWMKRAVFFSMLPDLVWWPFMAVYLLLGNPVPHSWVEAPLWFFQLYSLTHSLVIWLIIFILSSFILRKIQWPLFFWLLHILIDIPGHTHFTTPFLYPISDYQYRGHFNWEANPFLVFSTLVPVGVIIIRCLMEDRGRR